MKVEVYLVDMVSEAPMGAEARLNGSSTIAPMKKITKDCIGLQYALSVGVCVGVRY